MRMIDADMLADGLKLHRQSTDQKHETDRQWAVGYNAGLERALYSISYAPTLIPPNEPLTFAELREMEGEPVWVEHNNGGEWLVIHWDYVGRITTAHKACLLDYEYGRTWLAYRHPLEGEANG